MQWGVYMRVSRIGRGAATLIFCLLALARGFDALAQNTYDPGATDAEIKIGNVAPYTGPFSEYGQEARAEAAYFRMINDRGGINGRKINFVSVDDASDPRESSRLARQLVEKDQVLLLFSVFGTPANLAIRSYANEAKVPQLFGQSPSSKLNDPTHFPWTMGLFATFQTEAQAYAKYIQETWPNGKVGILRADDDVGREFAAGFREGFGDKASAAIVQDAIFKYSDPTTIDAQLRAIKGSGADILINLAFGKFGSQAIRSAFDLDWHPVQFIPNGSISIAAFLEPAGLDKAKGIISNARSKGAATVQSRSDPAVHDYLDWMSKYNPEGRLRDAANVSGYERAQLITEVLRKCGNDLTRANVMKQATSLDLELGMLRSGIRVTTSPTDYQPVKQLVLVKFNGLDWLPIGAIVGN
jgi:branched-chain amino acid transport system substrate-binding protein